MDSPAVDEPLAEEEQAATTWRHWLAAALYLPVLAIIAYLIFLCLVARFHQQGLGLYHFLYSLVFLVLVWRWVRILRGQIKAAQLWQDCIAMGFADAILVYLLLVTIQAGRPSHPPL